MGIFSKKSKVSLDLQSISTLISEGCVIKGNLTAPAYVRVDGMVTGDVAVDEGLILGEKGTVSGNIKTKELVVYGKVKGNITAHSLEIKASGQIIGEITTQILLVENGAVYNGTLTMTQSTKYEKPALIGTKEIGQLQ